MSTTQASLPHDTAQRYSFAAMPSAEVEALALELLANVEGLDVDGAARLAVGLYPALQDYCEVYDTRAAQLGNQHIFC